MTPSRRCALPLNRAEDDLLRVFELFFPAEVAVFEDEPARLLEVFARGVEVVAKEQPRAVKVDVGEVEWHRAALGDLLGFVEVRSGLGNPALHRHQPGPCKVSPGKVVGCASLAEPLDGGVEM